MSWPTWTATPTPMPTAMAAPVQSTLLPTAINSAPAVMPPGLQYSPEQWAQAQQQNWQQWAQWQQQYQQWHQQYGAEYQKSMSAIQGAIPAVQQPPLPGMPNTGVPPPLPAENKPPLPPEDPPVMQPAIPSYTTMPPKPVQGGYSTAPPPLMAQQMQAPPQNNEQYGNQRQNWPSTQVNPNKRPFTQGSEYENVKRPLMERPSNQWSNQKPNTAQWQNQPQQTASYHTQPPPKTQVTPKPNIEELSEAEKKFDKEFAAWEAQFNKWKDQNASHPDKTQYREYEKKWESWRNSLLERREQMRRKRLAMTNVPSNKPYGYNQPSAPQQQQQQQAPGDQSATPTPASLSAPSLLPTPATMLPSPAHPPAADPQVEKPSITDNLMNKPPPHQNNEPLNFKPPIDFTADVTEHTGDDFLKPSFSSDGGIPGLDLVKDDEGGTDNLVQKESVIDLEKDNKHIDESDEQSAPKKGPDFDAISKGINSILGDQKLLSMLSMVSQNPPAAPAPNVATDSVSNIGYSQGEHNFSAPPPPHQFNEAPPPVNLPPSVYGGDQSNHSYEDRSNHGDNYQQRESVNNFDDQTRSSFTMGPTDQDVGYGGNNFSRNQINKFPPSRFGGPPPDIDRGNNRNFAPGGLRSGDLRSGDLRAGDLRAGDLRSGDLRSGDLRPGDLRSGDPSFGNNILDNRNKIGPNRGDFRSGSFQQEPTSFNQGDSLLKRSEFGRGPGNFSQEPVGFNQGDSLLKRSEFGRGPGLFPQNTKSFNNQGDNVMNRSEFGRGPGNFSQNTKSFNNQGDNLMNHSEFGRGPGNFQQGDFNRGNNLNRSESFNRGGNYGGNFTRSDNFQNDKFDQENSLNRQGNNFKRDNYGSSNNFEERRGNFGGRGNFGRSDSFNRGDDYDENYDDARGDYNESGDYDDYENYNEDDDYDKYHNMFNEDDQNQDFQQPSHSQGPPHGRRQEQPPPVRRMEKPASLRRMDLPPPVRGVEPTSMRGMEPNSMRGMESTAMRGMEPTPMRGMEPTPMRGMEPTPMRGMEPTPMRGMEPTSMRGMEPLPVRINEPPLVQTPEPPPVEEAIFEPTTVIDYDHKSLKPVEPDVVVEPIYMFDYRHKPLNRIPIPQRPIWLSESVKFIREFDPLVPRPTLNFERPPIDRYGPNSRDSRRDDWHSDIPEDRYGSRNRNFDERERRYMNDYEDRVERRPFNRDDREREDKAREERDRDELRYERETKEDDDRQRRRFIEDDRFSRGRNNEGNLRNETRRNSRGYNEFEELSDEDMDFENGELQKHQQTRGERSASRSPILSNPPNPANISEVSMIEDIINPPGRFNRPPRIVIILRGPPGSGKTFLAKLIKDKEVENGGSAPRILSLDDYFMVEHEKEVIEDGKMIKVKEMVYEYEAEMEESYRTSFLKSFKKTITDGYFPFIIVDNVNDKVKHFGEMWSFAKQNGFQVYICQMDLDPVLCTKRNIHNRNEAEIEECIAGWEPTPNHHPTVDASGLLQASTISDVEMEEVEQLPEVAKLEEEPEDEVRSKWDTFDCSSNNLAKLDGVSKPLRPSRTMEEYLQLEDECELTKSTKPGQKRVRWADLEEQRQQKKMRAIGFIVGHTNWDRMMDPTEGSSALTRTKYIEKANKHY